MPPLGAIIGVVVLVALAAWAMAAFRRRVPTEPGDGSSYYESGAANIGDTDHHGPSDSSH